MPKQEEVRYTRTHEWIAQDGGEAVVGVSEHAQHEMGDIVFVELPKAGARTEQGKSCMVVESVKASFEINAPAAGEVTAVNEELSANQALINESPLEKGWLFRMKLSSPEDLGGLMDWAAYQEFVKSEVH